MSSLVKLMLSSILITLIILGLSSPVAAQPPSTPTIYVDAPDSVIVSTEFDIIISIRDIQSGWGMIDFDVQVSWDPNDLEFIECQFLGVGRPGWDGGCGADIGNGGGGGSGDLWTEDAEWFRFRFHCLREGPAPITVSSFDTVTLDLLTGGSVVATYPEPVTVTVNQVAAQLPSTYVDAPSTVTVSTEFDIIISIRDIPSGWGLLDFRFNVEWDPNDLEYIECEFLGFGRPGWNGGCGGSSPGFTGGIAGDLRSFPVSRWTEDAEWFRIRFHCLREGPAPITVSLPSIHLEYAGDSSVVDTFPEPVTVTVQQVSTPVGGVATPINKLEILTPYLALAGLIIAVPAIYVMRRRKD